MIVSDILAPKPAKVIFIDRNDPVEQFATRTLTYPVKCGDIVQILFQFAEK